MDYPNQTSGNGTPVQVENVQYDVKVGKVRSKIGLAAFLTSLSVWALALIMTLLLHSVRAKLLPSINDDMNGFAEQMVLSISMLVPIVPLLWYLTRRLNKILVENPTAIEDLFFKKTIRFHLVVSVIFAVWWIMVTVYNILAKTILDHQNITAGMILDSVIFALIYSYVAFFFFHYQNMTKR